MAVLQLHSVQKSFGKKRILETVSFQIETGDILGIYGHNGSGKSTLLKILFGTVEAKNVRLELNGKEIDPSEVIEKKQIGYLPQHVFLPKNRLVRDVIPMYHSSEEKQDKVFYNTGVAKITDKKTSDLSHGERKFFETVLLGHLDHPFLLLDEPFSMLEPFQIENLKAFIVELSKTKGIVLTDHYYEDVWDITTQNMVLNGGQGYLAKAKSDLKEYEYLRKGS